MWMCRPFFARNDRYTVVVMPLEREHDAAYLLTLEISLLQYKCAKYEHE